MSKKENSGWFKSNPGMFGWLIVLVIVVSWFPDDDSEVKKQPTTAYSAKPDKWWEGTDKYAICYANVTAAHKANGFHERNRRKSVQIKEELCKIAATSTTGEGCALLNNCEY
jgi:hypothetical protein